MIAGDLEKFEQNAQEKINALTNALKNSLVSSEDIVIAAYTIGNYTSDFNNSNYSKFWKEQVTPNLVKILTQDVKLRSFIAKFLSSIRNLSIYMQEGAEMVKTTKGSSGSIAVAQKTISAAINVLEDCIREASTLESTGMIKVADEIGQLHGMITSKSTDLDTQKAEINARIEEYHKERQELQSRRECQQGKVQHLHKLIQEVELLIKKQEKYLKEIKRSTDELIELNEKDERHIQSIPDNCQRSVTEDCNCRIFCHRSHRRTIVEKNPKKAELKSRSESKMAHRNVKIQENKFIEAEEKKFVISLKHQLDAYQSELQTVLNGPQSCQKNYEAKMQSIQNNIDKLCKDFTDIENQAAMLRCEVEETVIDNFTQIAILKENLYREASMKSQIVSILNAVKEPVQDSVALLTSGDDNNAYHATKRLVKQASFLANYSASASTLLQPTPKYSGLARAT